MNRTPSRPRPLVVANLLLAALSLGMVGCAAPLEYGDPVVATTDQEQAARLLEEMSLMANATRRGQLGPEQAFAMHSRFLEAQSLAVLDSRNPLQASGEVPDTDWADCTSGSATTKWTYEICQIVNGRASGTINGEVDMRALGVAYDLRLSYGPDAMNAFNLNGDLDVGEGRIIGTLEMRSQVAFATDEVVAGIDTGNTLGDVDTISTWDVGFDEVQGCLTGGTIQIEVEAKGEFRGARFVFDECGAPPRVQNATQRDQ